MRLSIVIPAYNEGAHIERIIRDIHDELQNVETDFEIIVVENGSRDNTRLVLEALQKKMPRVRVHALPVPGYGRAILAGLSMARGEIIGWTDSDGQIRPEILKEMYEKMRRENLTFLKARRTARHDGILRAMQSRIFNIIFRGLFSASVNDINAKPKLFRRSFYENITLTSIDWFIDAETVIKALRLGVSIKEHPITFQSRKGGASAIGAGAGFEFIKNLLYYRFLH
ncbi:MAG: glycosyltransferase family 2 protein [Candidatus Liptonbacteria bacterium]|nr:glycosyltransferase family 2 protein [Candidatus Liptonbacteria bacterium]